MRKAFALFFVLAFLLPMSAAAEDGLIANPDFEVIGDNHLPENWYKDMWYTGAGVSTLEADDGGYSGMCVKVSNNTENDARFCQDISVKPGTLYEITCMVKAEGVGEDAIGANISIKGTFCYSGYVFDTAGEWVKLTLYGRTGGDQYELTLCARVGGYSGINTGTAWFDDFTMTEISETPAGFDEWSFATVGSSGGGAAATDDDDEEPTRYTEAWVLFAFGMAVIALALLRKAKRPDRLDAKGHDTAFFCMLILAFIARIFIAGSVRGYNTDINCFMSWSERIYQTGFGGFYSESYFCDYPPLYMALLWLTAGIRNLLGIAYDSPAHWVLLKFTPMLCDMLLAVLVYIFARKRAGGRAAMLLGLVCAINPSAILDSAAWGQIDSVFTLFLILGAVSLTKREYITALPMFAVAMLIKPQALLFAPLGLFALVFDLITGKNRKELKNALIGLGVSAAVIALAALIFHERGVNPVKWLSSLYMGTMNSYDKLTINAFGLFELMGLNWADLSDHRALTICAWALFGLSYAYSFILYARSKRPSALFLASAVLMMLICAFGPMIHERYVYPAIVLLLLAYAVEGDRRILLSLAVLSVTLFMNEILVLQGGLTAANFGHLQSSENWLNCLMSLITIANALYIAYVAYSICFAGKKHALSECTEEAAPFHLNTLFENREWRLNLKRFDYIAMAAVTAAYGVLAFVNLGTLNSPESAWTSSKSGESVIFDLGEVSTYRMEYFGGICNTNFTVELSNDGTTWTAPCYAEYDSKQIYCWKFFVPEDESGTVIDDITEPTEDGSAYVTYRDTGKFPYQKSRFIRISAVSEGLKLLEIGFISETGETLSAAVSGHDGYLDGYADDPARLIDEQSAVPEVPSYFNSMYFDEIYHARTAYEFLHGLQVYEWTHPPLGKVLMMIGVAIFGMCPFGWRFMGTLAGVVMLPIMYLMVKQMGGSRKLSLVAMLLMALDSMHFTQTRIATIDSYAVLTIMLTYLFMFRYVRMSFNRQPLIKTLIPLALCGVCMGLAWATKWIGIYASAGLAVLFFWTLLRRFREHLAARRFAEDEFESDEERACLRAAKDKFWKNALITVGVCVVFFIIVPAVIYYLSYYWHMQYGGGLSVKRVIDLQKTMFGYHAGLTKDTHYFRSPWYEWPTIAWPIWYFDGSKYLASGLISSISCMGNPAVWWTGLAAIVAVIISCAWKRRADDTGLTISTGFLSQYLPWVLVPRSTFIYHYFASVPFIIMATAHMLGEFEKRNKKLFNALCIILVAAALILFVMFYPLESGAPVARSYAKYLRWFNWYNY